MTKQDDIYYYYDDESKIIYWADDMVDRQDLIFLGQSSNPNKKMAIAVFTHKLPEPTGWKLRAMFPVD